MRGPKSDYDDWGNLVGDNRWSYEGQLPYFKKTESHWTKQSGTQEQHGHSGPIRCEVPSVMGREYPLRQTVHDAYSAAGIAPLPGLDYNAGNNLGFGEICENRHHGRRQIASDVYPLGGVTVWTGTLVNRILLNNTAPGSPVAKGVVLTDGREIRARRTIAAAGAYRTPQLLMLSGIGPEAQLTAHGIKPRVIAEDVGCNLVDHAMLMTSWTLRESHRSVTVDSGNTAFFKPEYITGQPNNFIAFLPVQDKSGLAAAISRDEGAAPGNDHPLLRDKAFVEALIIYVNVNPALPKDSTYLTAANVAINPTARGKVTLATSDPLDAPVISPNFLGTEVDRFVWRDALRRMTRIMLAEDSPLSQAVEAEATMEGVTPLNVDVADEILDARVRQAAM